LTREPSKPLCQNVLVEKTGMKERIYELVVLRPAGGQLRRSQVMRIKAPPTTRLRIGRLERNQTITRKSRCSTIRDAARRTCSS
jgi:hypothetical protein